MTIDTMPREKFYDLTDQARVDKSTKSLSADPDLLRAALTKLDNDTLLAYNKRWDEEMAALNHWDIWAAGYIAAGSLSDDGFTDHRAWLIGKGITAVDAVIAHPDDLADFLPERNEEDAQNEDLGYTALHVFKERKLEIPLIETSLVLRGEMFDEDSEQLYLDYPKTTMVAITWGTYDEDTIPHSSK